MFCSRSWVFHAVLAAYLTIVVGIVETTLSFLAGRTDISMSLYAVALTSITDVAGGFLILTIWQNRVDDPNYIDKLERIEAAEAEKFTDFWYSLAIGVSMIVMGLFLMADRFEYDFTKISRFFCQSLHSKNLFIIDLTSNVSIRSLLEDSVTSSRDKDIGLVATSIGVSCSFILAMYKYEIGNQLQSLTISAGSFPYLL